MKKLLALVPIVLFLSAYILAYEDFILTIRIVLYAISVLTILVGIIIVVVAFFVSREKYRIIRAQRIEQEKEAHVKVVTAGNQIFIRDTDHKAWWYKPHLDPRPYFNSRETYEEPTQKQVDAWKQFFAPKIIEKTINQLSDGIENKPESLFDLLEMYPHLMLVGPTNTGKTSQMNQAISYRLQQYPGAKVCWLSTHTNLDMSNDNVHPKAVAVQQPAQIAQALKDIFNVYEKRRNGAQEYIQIIVALDEWPEIIDELKGILDAGEILRRLSRGGRKTAISLILASHGANTGDLGIKGYSSVKADFAEVHLSQKLTERNLAVWQQFNKTSSRVEITLPGPFYASSSGRVVELEIEPDEMREKILRMIDKGESYRFISQEIWGDGKFGTYYNEKITQILGEK